MFEPLVGLARGSCLADRLARAVTLAIDRAGPSGPPFKGLSCVRSLQGTASKAPACTYNAAYAPTSATTGDSSAGALVAGRAARPAAGAAAGAALVSVSGQGGRAQGGE